VEFVASAKRGVCSDVGRGKLADKRAHPET
jgi:hypothetical protein